VSSPIEKRFDRLFITFLKQQPVGAIRNYSLYAWIRAWTVFLAREMEILIELDEK
jgi:hypothetical protein